MKHFSIMTFIFLMSCSSLIDHNYPAYPKENIGQWYDDNVLFHSVTKEQVPCRQSETYGQTVSIEITIDGAFFGMLSNDIELVTPGNETHRVWTRSDYGDFYKITFDPIENVIRVFDVSFLFADHHRITEFSLSNYSSNVYELPVISKGGIVQCNGA